MVLSRLPLLALSRATSSSPSLLPLSLSCTRFPLPHLAHLRCVPCRRLATHTDRPSRETYTNPDAQTDRGPSASATFHSDLLDRLEAEARQKAAAASGQRDSIGPFPLGVGPSGRSRAWKRWSELGVAGKVARTTAQTGNLTVILVGGGLFVLLAFALTTELFATNSPSVMYSHCVDMIRDSNALDIHLLPPLSFTHSPHSSSPTRGSAPVVHTFARHPTSGRDHLLLTFWVHGRGKDEPERLLGVAGWRWVRDTVTQGFEKAVGALGLGLTQAEEEARDEAAGEVTGKDGVKQVQQQQQQNQAEGWLNRVVGSFSALRSGGVGGAKAASTRGLPPPGTYIVGEVRADYVKNASGQFTLLSLVVDIPSSRVAYPNRAVVFWSPDADTEGLLPRRR